MLALECRRCERSGSRFALALIALEPKDGQRPLAGGETLAAAVAASMRETDITGWYEEPATLGVILTTLNGASRPALEEVVFSRIGRALESHLGSEVAGRVRVTCSFFPDDSDAGAGNSGGSQRTFPQPEPARKNGSRSQALKRALDIAGSASALVVLSPLFLAVSILIRLTSPGPVFFRQERVGRGGREFTLLKFRSMYVDTDADLHKEFVQRFIENNQDQEAGVYKLTNDPRITPLGNLLRKGSLDELPQFLNVLTGDMSLVGPRPPIRYELERYSLWHLRRIQGVKPGITGEWQVNGRSRTTFDEMVRLDLRYVRTRSLWKDIRILLATPRAVVTGKGAS
jgi:lipopolysaccharide/colanic/teichoic acid biosynthesis glycosyltransferase